MNRYAQDCLRARSLQASCCVEPPAQAMDVSCHSFLRMARLAEPLMHKHVGSLLTMSYLGADEVITNFGLMGPVKDALEASVRDLAPELGPQGIRVNAASPGPLVARAGPSQAHFDTLLAETAERAPLRRLVTIEEVGARLCLPGHRRRPGHHRRHPLHRCWHPHPGSI